jgi:hypothetical protein
MSKREQTGIENEGLTLQAYNVAGALKFFDFVVHYFTSYDIFIDVMMSSAAAKRQHA